MLTRHRAKDEGAVLPSTFQESQQSRVVSKRTSARIAALPTQRPLVRTEVQSARQVMERRSVTSASRAAASAQLASKRRAAASQRASKSRTAASAQRASKSRTAASAQRASKSRTAASAQRASKSRTAASAQRASKSRTAASAQLASKSRTAASAQRASKSRTAASAQRASKSRTSASARRASKSRAAASTQQALKDSAAASAQRSSKRRAAASAQRASKSRAAASAQRAPKSRTAASAQRALKGRAVRAAKFSTTIAALSDQTLVDIFSYVDTDTLLEISKVCRRWAELSVSRSLWGSVLIPAATDEDFIKMLRLLRRSRAIPPYTDLIIKTAVSPSLGGAAFTEKGSRLEVSPPTPLMLAMCLRELVKPTVSRLVLTDYGRLLMTQLEAFHIWDAIASKVSTLSSLELNVHRSTRLLSTTYQWLERQRGLRLSALSVSVWGAGALSTPSLPLQSLLRVFGPQLSTLYLRPEDHQSALRWCSSFVTHFGAVLLPTLPNVLERMYRLKHLFLYASDSGGQELELLRQVVDLRNMQYSLLQLEVYAKFKEAESAGTIAGSAETLAAVSQCQCLRWLHLSGFGSLMADPRRGQPALAGLLSGLGSLKWISLNLPPCIVLQGNPDSGRGSSLLGSVADLLPESLYLLMLDGNDHACERQGCVSAVFNPASLRRLQGRATPLHIQVTHRCPSMHQLPKQFIILPHAKDAYCQDCRICSRLVYSLKSFNTYSFEDLLSI